MLPQAMQAADTLANEGIQRKVIDPRTLLPLDTQTLLTSARKTGRLVTAREAHERAGPGAKTAALVAEQALNYLDAPIRRVAAKNVPLPYAPAPKNLCCQAKKISSLQ
jgi:pyruvate/2-oxoglutarate/acetoin dehydrogenase E1 component